jgi:hypothetical protein
VSWFRRKKKEPPVKSARITPPSEARVTPKKPPPAERSPEPPQLRDEPRKADAKPEPSTPPPAGPAAMRQAEFALEEGIVTSDKLRDEIHRATAESTPLGRALLNLPYPELSELAVVLGRVIIPRIDVERISPSEEALRRLPPQVAHARDCLPLEVFGNILCVAMARPEDLSGIREIRDATGLRVKALRGDGATIRRLIERHYPEGSTPRAFRLRALPVSEESYLRSRGRNRIANEIADEWESVWLHGEALEAEPGDDDD